MDFSPLPTELPCFPRCHIAACPGGGGLQPALSAHTKPPDKIRSNSHFVPETVLKISGGRDLLDVLQPRGNIPGMQAGGQLSGWKMSTEMFALCLASGKSPSSCPRFPALSARGAGGRARRSRAGLEDTAGAVSNGNAPTKKHRGTGWMETPAPGSPQRERRAGLSGHGAQGVRSARSQGRCGHTGVC